MIVDIEYNCKVCGKLRHTQYDSQDKISIEQLDIFRSWLTCDDCLREKGYMRKLRFKQAPLPEAEPRVGEARQVGQVGLPYKDD